MFLPPVGESPVLSPELVGQTESHNVSTPCRGITCAENFYQLPKKKSKGFYPLSGNHLC